jgi:hypothetical protein
VIKGIPIDIAALHAPKVNTILAIEVISFLRSVFFVWQLALGGNHEVKNIEYR